MTSFLTVAARDSARGCFLTLVTMLAMAGCGGSDQTDLNTANARWVIQETSEVDGEEKTRIMVSFKKSGEIWIVTPGRNAEYSQVSAPSAASTPEAAPETKEVKK